jgi:hypothetical protein
MAVCECNVLIPQTTYTPTHTHTIQTHTHTHRHTHTHTHTHLSYPTQLATHRHPPPFPHKKSDTCVHCRASIFGTLRLPSNTDWISPGENRRRIDDISRHFLVDIQCRGWPHTRAAPPLRDIQLNAGYAAGVFAFGERVGHRFFSDFPHVSLGNGVEAYWHLCVDHPFTIWDPVAGPGRTQGPCLERSMSGMYRRSNVET